MFNVIAFDGKDYKRFHVGHLGEIVDQTSGMWVALNLELTKIHGLIDCIVSSTLWKLQLELDAEMFLKANRSIFFDEDPIPMVLTDDHGESRSVDTKDELFEIIKHRDFNEYDIKLMIKDVKEIMIRYKEGFKQFAADHDRLSKENEQLKITLRRILRVNAQAGPGSRKEVRHLIESAFTSNCNCGVVKNDDPSTETASCHGEGESE